MNNMKRFDIWQRRNTSSGTFDTKKAGKEMARGKWFVKKEN